MEFSGSSRAVPVWHWANAAPSLQRIERWMIRNANALREQILFLLGLYLSCSAFSWSRTGTLPDEQQHTCAFRRLSRQQRMRRLLREPALAADQRKRIAEFSLRFVPSTATPIVTDWIVL